MKLFARFFAGLADTADTPAVQCEAMEIRWLCSGTKVKVPKPPKYVIGHHVYADGTFKPANWQTTPVTLGSGGTSTIIQEKNGGKPGAYQLVVDTVNSGSSDSYIFGFQGNTKAIFNPVKQGAITSINYAEVNRLISGFGEGERTGPAVMQNGQIYFLLDQALVTPQVKWTKTSAVNLTAADFSTLDASATHPDFSQTAAPIEFGYYRANSAGYSGYTIEAGIDNWTMLVRTRRQV